MNTDLLGRPLGKQPPFELSLWQRRQAAILYHFASLDYLKAVKQKADELVAWVEDVLDKRRPLDPTMREIGWAPADTAGNWATLAFPLLADLQQGLARKIAERAFESYSITNISSTAGGLRNFSLNWTTPEQEQDFNETFQSLYRAALEIDYTVDSVSTRNDFSFILAWERLGDELSPLPEFRVRTDCEAESGFTPPRTGVYVPQDDPLGALRFGWTGGDRNTLGKCMTYSEIGLEALRILGRDQLWSNLDGILDFVMHGRFHDAFDPSYYFVEGAPEPLSARSSLDYEAFVMRPCKWYFVERISD